MSSLDVLEAQGNAFDLQKMLPMLRRRRALIAGVAVVLIVPALMIPLILPDLYAASAKVQILGRPEVMSFGADFMPETVRSRKHPLSPKMALIMSDRILGRVADQTPDRERAAGGLLSRALISWGLLADPAQRSPELERQTRIDSLRGEVKLDDLGGGSVLVVSMTGTDAAMTAFRVNAIADAFVSYEVDQRATASRDVITWLNQRASELRDQIHRREEAMSALAPDLGDVLVGSMDRDNSAKDQLSRELRNARIELLAARRRRAEIGARLRSLTSGQAGNSIGEMRSRYVTAKVELESARLRFTSTHPEVARLEAILEDLERELSQLDRTSATAPTGAELQSEYRQVQAESSKLGARVGVLEKALRDLVAATSEHAGAITEYGRLEREAEVSREMLEVLHRRLNETVLQASENSVSSRILDYAVRPTEPVAPNRPLLLGLALLLCAGLSIGAGILREWIDPGLYDAEDVARALDAPLLARIPLTPAGDVPELQTTLRHGTAAGESYRNLRTAIFFARGSHPLRSLQLASAVAGEGKTTVAINLAVSIAQTGRRVLLIDADLRRPRVDRVIPMLRAPGLAELIRGDTKLEEALRRPSGFDLDVMPSGELPENPSELLESQAFEKLMDGLVATYDLVILDGPVLLSVSDALLVASRVDRVLLVNKLGSVDRRAFERMRHDLVRIGADVVGLVVNQVPGDDPYQYPSYLESPYVPRAPRQRLYSPLRSLREMLSRMRA